MSKNLIVDYYDTCESDYRLFWDLDHSLALHAGFWDETTKSLRQALHRENEVLAKIAGIQPYEKVLDAGCGVGGSSIFLAKHVGCQVTGITLSEKQMNSAKKNSELAKTSALTTFFIEDFTQTSFPDASFDVVWALESVCHAKDKNLFIKESFRLLKNGGRLIVADGFASKLHFEDQERIQMQRWLRGWGVESLETIERFNSCIENIGFKQIQFQDITHHVMPSSKRLYRVSFPALIFSKLGQLAGYRDQNQTENIQGARYQYLTLKKKLWSYGIFLAKKIEKA